VAVLPIETVLSTPNLHLKPIAVHKTISALKEAAIFATQLRKATARVEQIIRETTQKSVVTSSVTGANVVGRMSKMTRMEDGSCLMVLGSEKCR
jgi:hypothetical protein